MANITLSMIVKNEEKYLRECLESVKGIVSEIVVVDTGSEDSTIKIAEEYGAKIFNFEWINDFSAARNFALSKSSGDWILYLDADERLDERSKEELLRRTEDVKKVGYYCLIKNLDSEESHDNSFRYIRLFANNPNINFEGTVHEQIEDSLKRNNYLLVNSQISITHVGYNISVEEKKKKAERNLELLQNEYKKDNSAYVAFQLGQTYNVLKDKKKAVEYFTIAAESPKLDRVYKAQCYTSMALIANQNHKSGEAEKLIIKSLKFNDNQPFAYLLASKISLRAEDYQRAEERCKKAYQLNEQMAKSPSQNLMDIMLDPEEIISHGLILALRNKSDFNLKYYLQELEKTVKSLKIVDYEILMSAARKVIQSTEITPREISILEQFARPVNLNLYVFLLNSYRHPKIRAVVLESLDKKFGNNGEIIKLLAKTYDETGNINEAINIIEKSSELRESDPAALFYLVSFYLKKGDMNKLGEIITELDNKFKDIPEVSVRVTTLKEKLAHVLK